VGEGRPDEVALLVRLLARPLGLAPYLPAGPALRARVEAARAALA
jgi:hypothetical protein